MPQNAWKGSVAGFISIDLVGCWCDAVSKILFILGAEFTKTSVGAVAGQQRVQSGKRVDFGEQQQQRRWSDRGLVGRRRRQFVQHNFGDAAVAVVGRLPRRRLHAESRTDLHGSHGRRSRSSFSSPTPPPSPPPGRSPVPVASGSAPRRSRGRCRRAPPQHFGHVSDQPGSRLARLSSPGVDGDSVLVAPSPSSLPPSPTSPPPRPNATSSTAAEQFECLSAATQCSLVNILRNSSILFHTTTTEKGRKLEIVTLFLII